MSRNMTWIAKQQQKKQRGGPDWVVWVVRESSQYAKVAGSGPTTNECINNTGVSGTNWCFSLYV